MNGLISDEMMAEAISAAGLSAEAVVPGPAPLASPSYQALESRSAFADGRFVKRMHPEMRDFFDLQSAMQCASQAGLAGAGPVVHHADAATGVIVMDALGDGWITCRQNDLQLPGLVAQAMKAMKTLHATAPLPARFDPFARIDALIEMSGQDGIALPDDILWLRRVIAMAEGLGDSGARAPCRNDGSASNIMAGPDGRVMLVDYDRAGMNDPLYDLGCLLAEITDHERDMHAGYVAYAGSFDEGGFARARLWAHVDDMHHALLARLMAHRSERSAVEWVKYGEWRLLRLRLSLRDPHYEEKIRLAGEAA